MTCCASPSDACGCSKTDYVYHQLEAQHLNGENEGIGQPNTPSKQRHKAGKFSFKLEEENAETSRTLDGEHESSVMKDERKESGVAFPTRDRRLCEPGREDRARDDR